MSFQFRLYDASFRQREECFSHICLPTAEGFFQQGFVKYIKLAALFFSYLTSFFSRRYS